MKIASIFLAAAASMTMISGAYATDAVVPDDLPSLGAQGVNVCDAYGVGFVAVGGTGTCVRVSGQVRYERNFSSGGRSGSLGRTTLDFETRSD